MNESMRMTRIVLLLIAAIATVSLGSMADTRGPIKILGDSDFTTENGVVSGSGSPADPYVISGWEIDVNPDDVYGVQVENATSSFVLRGLAIRNATNIEGSAIRIGFSSGGRIDDCTIIGAINGIRIISSTGIEMVDCVILASGRGLRVEGDLADEYRHLIDRTNRFNDRPIVYLHGLDGETIEGETTSHLTVADSRNVTITGNNVINGDGIQLAFVTDSTISGNEAFRTTPALTEHGIHAYRSERNVFSENSLRNNRLAGIQLSLSTDNELVENQFLANDIGLRLLASDRNLITENVAFANVIGIVLTGGSSDNEVVGNVVYHENTKQGIALELAIGNLVARNGVTGCEIGIVLDVGANENRIIENTVVAGAYGMSVYGSFNEIERNLLSQHSRGILFPETYTRSTTRGNLFRGNVFSDNGSHVYANLDSTENTFTENAFLGDGIAKVLDHGSGNRWSLDGIGNFWGDTAVVDEDGDGFSDDPITVYPSVVDDVAPLSSIVPSEAGLGILGTLPSREITIEREGGSSAEILVVHAVEGFERWAGFRGFPEALLDGFPGILFEFEEEADRRFTMETVLFDLDIAFFDADGLLVGRETMLANNEELYQAAKPAQYALELPAGSLDGLSIEVNDRLLLP